MPVYELDFFLGNFAIGSRFGLPQYFAPDREVPSLLPSKVLGNKRTSRASKIVDAVGQILADVDLPVWIGDSVNDLHRVRTNVT